MLLAVALTCGGVHTGLKMTLIEKWSVGVLVIDMTIPFFLIRPASLDVLAVGFHAFPGTCVRCFMLAVMD
jgi:hypothetical protein